MDESYIIRLGQGMLTTAVTLGAPIILSAMAVGVVMALFQAVTSVQEQTLSIIPKLVAVGAVTLVMLPWMFRTMAGYTTEVLTSIVDAVH